MFSPITSQVPKYLLANDSLTAIVNGSLRADDWSPAMKGMVKILKIVESANEILSSLKVSSSLWK